MGRKWQMTVGALVIAVMMFFGSGTEAFAAYPQVDGYASVTTIKGQQTGLDDQNYGSQHAFQNFDITQCYIPDNYPECGVPYYEFEGKKYRFYDYTYMIAWVGNQNRAGRTANVQFMISWERDDSLAQRRLLVEDAARTPTGYYAPATTGEGRQILRAFWSWLMSSLAQQGYHIDNVILGNEVNMPNSWHYSGNVGTQATVENYAKAFYDMRQGVRKYTNKTRCSICVDHSWTHNDEGRGIAARDFIRIFNSTLTNLNGGVAVDDWCVALHLYPSILYETAIWQDTPGFPANLNALSQDAKFVDGRNLSFITSYIKNTYGENHRIMLTEQGFTNYRGEDKQAASLAYSYYAAKYDPMVDCFILNIENTGDPRLDFRIRGRKAEDVYRNIDSASQQQRIADMLLPVIGVNSWSSIIPNYGQAITRKPYVGSGYIGSEPDGITLSTSTLSLYEGESGVLTATVSPADAYDKNVTWVSSNPAIATVDNGAVKGVSQGNAVITARTVNGREARCSVNVKKKIQPEKIALNQTSVNMIKGETVTLIATVTPTNAYDRTVKWTSDHPGVATVSNGVVKAVGAGNAEITTRTVNGLIAKCTVNVILDPSPDNPFGDVDSTSGWEYSFVRYVYDNGFMRGKGEIIPGKIRFDPNGNITRSEFVQVLYSMEGKPEVSYVDKFRDVPKGQWYTNAIIWAAETGIVTGKGNDYFDVYGNATRQELATMFRKYTKYKGRDVSGQADLSAFVDQNLISSWALENMRWAVDYGLISGKGERLDPTGLARRSECAAMLKKLHEKLQQTENVQQTDGAQKPEDVPQEGQEGKEEQAETFSTEEQEQIGVQSTEELQEPMEEITIWTEELTPTQNGTT